MKKFKLPSELAYILGIILLTFAVALCTKADFGVSMLAAPSYIVSKAIPLTFGQTEYVFQALVFIVMCLVLKSFNPAHLSTFITTILYGAFLDLWILILDFEVSNLVARLLMMVAGIVITAFAIALFFRTYFPSRVYDLFVKEVSKKYNFQREKFKLYFDLTFFALALILTFSIFHKLQGVGLATLLATMFNALLISVFGKIIDKYVDIKPASKKMEGFFIKNEKAL